MDPLGLCFCRDAGGLGFEVRGQGLLRDKLRREGMEMKQLIRWMWECAKIRGTLFRGPIIRILQFRVLYRKLPFGSGG